MAKQLKKAEAVYVCGYDYCQARIIMPNRGEACYKKHRDANGFVCDGLLVRYDISPIGRAEEIQLRWFKKRFPERQGAKNVRKGTTT